MTRMKRLTMMVLLPVIGIILAAGTAEAVKGRAKLNCPYSPENAILGYCTTVEACREACDVYYPGTGYCGGGANCCLCE